MATSDNSIIEALKMHDVAASYNSPSMGTRLGIVLDSTVAGLQNNVSMIGNAIAGRDVNELRDLSKEYEQVDSDLASYYDDNKGAYDLAGELIAGFGAGGLALKGIGLAKSGVMGANVATKAGYLANKRTKYLKQVDDAIFSSGSQAELNGLKGKIFATEIGEQIIEGAIFETVAYAATGLGTTLNDDSLTGFEKVLSSGGRVLGFGAGFGAVSGVLGGAIRNIKINKTWKGAIEKAEQPFVTVKTAKAMNMDTGSVISDINSQITKIEAMDVKVLAKGDSRLEGLISRSKAQTIENLTIEKRLAIKTMMKDSVNKGNKDEILNLVTDGNLDAVSDTFALGTSVDGIKFSDIVKNYPVEDQLRAGGISSYDNMTDLITKHPEFTDLVASLEPIPPILTTKSGKLVLSPTHTTDDITEVLALRTASSGKLPLGVQSLSAEAQVELRTLRGLNEGTLIALTSKDLIQGIRSLVTTDGKVARANSKLYPNLVKELDGTGLKGYKATELEPVMFLRTKDGQLLDGVHPTLGDLGIESGAIRLGRSNKNSRATGSVVAGGKAYHAKPWADVAESLDAQAQWLIAHASDVRVSKTKNINVDDLPWLENEIRLAEKELASGVPNADITLKVQVGDNALGGKSSTLTLAGAKQVLETKKVEQFNALMKARPETSLDEASLWLNAELIKDGTQLNFKSLIDANHNIGKQKHVAIRYNIPDDMNFNNGVSGNRIYVETQIQEHTIKAKAIAENILGEDVIRNMPEEIGYTAERAGAKWIRNASGAGDYLSPIHTMASIGEVVVDHIKRLVTKVEDDLSYSTSKLVGSAEASREFTVMRKWYETADEQVFFVPELKALVKSGTYKKLQEAIAKGDNTLAPKLVHGNNGNIFQLKADELTEFVTDWDRINKTNISYNKHKIATAYNRSANWNPDAFYLPLPKSEFFVYMRPPSGGKEAISKLGDEYPIGRLHGNSIAHLKEQIASAKKSFPDWQYVSKEQSAEWFKAGKEYDLVKDVRSSFVNSELTKQGFGSNFIPNFDIAQQMEQLGGWVSSNIHSINRQAVELKYVDYFQGLKGFSDSANKFKNSATNSAIRNTEVADNIYESARNTILGIRADDYVPVFDHLQDFVTKWSDKLANNIFELKRQGNIADDDWVKANLAMESAGYKAPFADAITYATSSKIDFTKPRLIKAVGKMNMALSTLMLRLDGVEPIMNTIGYAVNSVPELRSLIKELERSKVIEGGLDTGVFSIAKLMKQALTDVSPAGGAKAKAIRERHISEGLSRGSTRNYQELYDEASDGISLISNKTTSGARAEDEFVRLSERLVEKGKKIVDTLATPSDASNEILQSAAIRAVEIILERAPNMGQAQRRSIIMAHRNRVLAATSGHHRPTLFQGAIGLSMSLFQNYQFNLMSNLLRYVEKNEGKNLALFGAMQTSIFGLQSAPGFHYLNTSVVGSNSGAEHNDIISSAYTILGKDLGESIMYGAASAVTGAALYTRGDLNPHNTFILPTSLAEFPVYRAATKAFGTTVKALTNIGNGAPVSTSLIDGFANIGLNRPTAGIINSLRGYSTDNYSQLKFGHAEFFSSATLWRMAGAKPIQEAVNDSMYHRNRVYRAVDTKKMDELGSAIRIELLGQGQNASVEDLDEGLVARVAGKYVGMGGKMINFDNWMVRQLTKATQPKAQRVEKLLQSSQQLPAFRATTGLGLGDLSALGTGLNSTGGADDGVIY